MHLNFCLFVWIWGGVSLSLLYLIGILPSFMNPCNSCVCSSCGNPKFSQTFFIASLFTYFFSFNGIFSNTLISRQLEFCCHCLIWSAISAFCFKYLIFLKVALICHFSEFSEAYQVSLKVLPLALSFSQEHFVYGQFPILSIRRCHDSVNSDA